jgi:hypothetical protein
MLSISAIVITPDSCATVSRTLDCLRAQTVRDRLEIVLVGPASAVREAESMGLERVFGGVRTVTVDPFRLTRDARAAGIRAASAPIVVLTEDHSWPAPQWAEALIGAHAGGCAVAGPAVVNANPASVVSWANFLIEYSEWMWPCPAGPVDHVPGHNSAYRRDVLLEMGDRYVHRLDAESTLHWEFRARGLGVCLAPDAVTRHLNFSRFRPSIRVRFSGGRLFAGVRRTGWGWPRRLLYAGGFALLPPLRLWRILLRLRHPGRASQVPWPAYPAAAALLVVDALGECAGYLFGSGRSDAVISSIDFHRETFLCLADRARLGFGQS